MALFEDLMTHIKNYLTIIISLIILSCFSVCHAFDVRFAPGDPKGGECILVNIDGSGMFSYKINFNNGNYEPFRSFNNTKEIFIPLKIKDKAVRELTVTKKFIGITFSRQVIDVIVTPRKIKKYYLKGRSLKMREKQPPVKEQKEIIKEKLKYVSKDRLWGNGFMIPIDAPVSSPFALHRIAKTYSYHHSGTDLVASSGTPVGAANSGKVILSREGFNVYGKAIIVDHGQGVISCYYHLSQLLKREGDPVGQGDIIGKVGSTGWSTNPHLHFGIYIQGQPIDPHWWVRFTKYLYDD